MRILAELTRIALADPAAILDGRGRVRDLTDMPSDTRRAIASVKVTELYEGSGENRELVGFTKEVKFWSKPDALTTLGRSLGVVTNAVRIEASGDVAELLREIRAAREREARLQAVPTARLAAARPAPLPPTTDDHHV